MPEPYHSHSIGDVLISTDPSVGTFMLVVGRRCVSGITRQQLAHIYHITSTIMQSPWGTDEK